MNNSKKITINNKEYELVYNALTYIAYGDVFKNQDIFKDIDTINTWVMVLKLFTRENYLLLKN